MIYAELTNECAPTCADPDITVKLLEQMSKELGSNADIWICPGESTTNVW